MILRMQSLGTQVKRPLSFQSDPSPRIRGTQSLGSSSNIYYHLFLTWTLHNLWHFLASRPLSASMIQLLKVTASLNLLHDSHTVCPTHYRNCPGKNKVHTYAMVSPWILDKAANSTKTGKKSPANEWKHESTHLIYTSSLHYGKYSSTQTRPTWKRVLHYVLWWQKINSPALSYLLA